MQLTHARSKFMSWIRKRRVLLVLALISVLAGLADLGAPLELMLQSVRNKVRAQPVSSQVVVAGIDDPSITSQGPWPWKRERIAELTERLFDAGANRVFYNIYLQPQDAAGDRVLADTIARHPGQVFAAAKIDYSVNPGAGRDILPMKALEGKAQTVSTARYVQFWNGVSVIPYRMRIGGREVDSMESVLSGVYGKTDETFPIDYAYQVSSVPYVSAADLLTHKPLPVSLRGKDVVLGFNSTALGPQLGILGQRRAADVFVVALGAETLKKGHPFVLGWWPAWGLALISAAYVLSENRKPWKRLINPALFLGLLIVPGLLESFNIFADVFPGLLMTIMASVAALWRRFGARQKDSGTINPISGLFTVNAIRHDDRLDKRPLVAARIRRYADVVSALPPDNEQALIKEILGRLELGAGGAQLLHGDDGNFFWLAPVDEHEQLVEQFQALHVIFRSPVRVMNKTFDFDISFGVDREFDVPLSHRITSALAAAHSAEQDGTCWRLHDPTALKEKEWTLSLLGELDEALRNGHIWVAFQPKLDMMTRTITGAEALVRWTHPTRGPVSPMEFVAMAERHGRIDKLTAFVLDEALKITKSVLRSSPGFTISVNISPGLLATREIYDTVKDALDRYQLDPSCLILEVTETMAIVQSETPRLLMDKFRSMGIGLSIDDYGTGLSTLEYLRKIPATELKIDRAFTKDICVSPADQAVMKSTIQLAHALSMKAVAEGIETAESLYLLASMGCDMGQGYHIARPMDANSLIELINTENVTARHG